MGAGIRLLDNKSARLELPHNFPPGQQSEGEEAVARLSVYRLQRLAGAACKMMGTEAPLQKPCASHRGSSAAWSGFGSRKMLFIP
jgi:hypothetical protein